MEMHYMCNISCIIYYSMQNKTNTLLKYCEVMFTIRLLILLICEPMKDYFSITDFSPGISNRLVSPVQLMSSFWEEIRKGMCCM